MAAQIDEKISKNSAVQLQPISTSATVYSRLLVSVRKQLGPCPSTGSSPKNSQACCLFKNRQEATFPLIELISNGNAQMQAYASSHKKCMTNWDPIAPRVVQTWHTNAAAFSCFEEPHVQHARFWRTGFQAWSHWQLHEETNALNPCATETQVVNAAGLNTWNSMWMPIVHVSAFCLVVIRCHDVRAVHLSMIHSNEWIYWRMSMVSITATTLKSFLCLVAVEDWWRNCSQSQQSNCAKISQKTQQPQLDG